MMAEAVDEWSHVSDAKLEKSDLAKLHESVTPIKAKWENFATQLGIPSGEVAAVRLATPDPNGCLRKVLEEWLKGNHDTKQHGHPSWRRVCEAVASPAGGENKELARKIAAQHCQKDQAEETGQSGPTPDDRDYDQPYGCGCGKCTIDTFLEKGCPTPAKHEELPLFQFNPTHELADKLNKGVQWKLEQETRAICNKFKKVVHKAWKSLRENRVSVEEVASFLEHYLSNTHDTTSFQGINDYHGLLRVLDKNISWFNYELFGYVVEEFLQDQSQILALWESYKEDLKEYAKERVEEYEGVSFGYQASDEQKVLLLPIDRQYNMKLSDIPALRSSICNILGCPFTLLYFVAIRRSSIILEFLIPLLAYELLIPLSQEQLRELAKLGIISVDIGDTRVFPDLAEWSGVSDVTLERVDQPLLTAAVKDVSAKWEGFATKLGLSQETIINIRDRLTNSHDCLLQVLDVWLEGNYNQFEYGPPTWKRVCAAVASPTGGGNRHLAVEIAAQHPAQPTTAVDLSLNAGAKSKQQKRTTLMIASEYGHSKIVNLLLKADTNPEHQKDNKGASLMIASQNGHSEVVNLLLNAGANPEHHENNGWTALMFASQNGHSEVVYLLLNAGANPEHQENNGWTALMFASQNGHSEVVNLLLKAGANSQQQQNDRWFALIIASKNGHSEVVNLLLKAGVDPEQQDTDGFTALMVASQNGHCEVVNLLLKVGANPEHQENNGWTALIFASQNGHSEVVNLLLNARANPEHQEIDGWTALMIASANGHSEIVSRLLNAHANPEKQENGGFTALIVASQNGHSEVVNLLLNAHANLEHQDNHGWTPLIFASQNGHSVVVNLLLNAHASPEHQENDGWTALMFASQNGHSDVVNLLLKAGANSQQQQNEKWTPLMIASQNGHSEAVNLLLKAGANPEHQNQNGSTALIIASHNGHSEVVNLLLNARANPENQENNGLTALMFASQNGHSEVVNLLLNARANPENQENNGLTALMFASQNGHSEVVNLLLNARANPENQENNGLTALMFASQHGHSNVVNLLLKAGANSQHEQNDKWTALMLASENGHSEVVDLLLKAGANPEQQENNGFTALMIASENGLSEVVNLLLKAGANPEQQDCNGSTSLIKGSQNGHSEVVNLLLKANANPDHQNRNGLTCLMKGSQNGHSEVVKLLLKAGVNPDQQKNDGWTSLMMASQNAHSEVVKLLIKAGANPNQQKTNGFTALMLASQDGHTDVANLLLNAGANPEQQKNDGCTALMLASQNGHSQIVNLLLKAGANPEHRDNDEGTALIIASLQGHCEIVNLLLNAGANPEHHNRDGWTSLMTASWSGHSQVVSCLLQDSVNPEQQNQNGWTSLMAASLKGHSEVVNLLVKAGAKLEQQNQNGLTTLMLASRNGHSEVVSILLGAGANPEQQENDGYTALMIASQNGHSEAVNILLKAGANLEHQNQNKSTALMIANQNGHFKVVKILLKAGANPEHQNENGWTALMIASHNSHSEAVNLLLEAGANPEQQQNDGFTALMIASEKGHSEAVNLLLKSGANTEHQNQDGWTALMIASQNGHSEVVNLLLKAGANTKHQNQGGWTALMKASQNGHSEAVNLLLKAGANLEQQDQNGWTALMTASQNGHSEAVIILLKAGANPEQKQSDGLTALMIASVNGHSEIVNLFPRANVNPEQPDISEKVLHNAYSQPTFSTMTAYKQYWKERSDGDNSQGGELPLSDMRIVAPESSALDERCSPLHIAQLSEHIENWEELAPYFNVTPAEEQEIRANHFHQYKLQKRKMLWMWVKKQGKEATYRKLKQTFLAAGNALLATAVEEILQDTYSLSPHRSVATFKQYLKDCYSSFSAFSAVSSDHEWPRLSDAPVMYPEMVFGNQKVNIRDLFQDIKHQTVLLEGVAGCGKTTLTRYICQQWADGSLLRDVDLLIHLTLADPTLWSAFSLEDMIPHPVAEIRKAVADVIMERGGKRCCFVMDGWEDLPEKMQRASFIRTILKGKKPGVSLAYCTFIVTSRPIASASLKPLVTTTVEITGFSAESVDSYATQYLTQHGKDPTVFITALNDNPLTRELSSIPINAAILLHIFLTIQTGFPTTQTELFRCFLLNLLLHHLVSKTGHRLHRLRDFSDLPDSVDQSFHRLCLIAHYATFSGKTAAQGSQLLSSDDLRQAGLHNVQETLGLMKVHQQLTWFGYDPQYGFLHSSVQDFLCAVRMSQLSAEEQVRDFQHIVSSNPTSLILPFYAGITKLGNEGVCRGLQKIGMKTPNQFSVLPELSVTMSEAGDTRRLFLAYLHCLYEANRQDLLVKPLDVSYFRFTSISFMYYRLSVYDLSVVCYFLLDLARICYPNNVNISFASCFLGDHGFESGVTTLINRAHTQHQSYKIRLNIHLDTTANNLTHKGVGAILSVCEFFGGLNFSRNLHSPSSSGFTALKLLTEALSSGTASQIEYLSIADCLLTSRHAYHLLLFISQARNLKHLDISLNQLQESVPLLVSAAKNLTQLDLNASGIGEKELLEIGLILQSNTNMRRLHITSSSPMYDTMDSIKFETVSSFIEMIIAPDSQSCLEVLCIADCYLESLKCDRIQNALKRLTSRRGFPLEITSLMRTNVGRNLLQLTRAVGSLPDALLFGKT